MMHGVDEVAVKCIKAEAPSSKAGWQRRKRDEVEASRVAAC